MVCVVYLNDNEFPVGFDRTHHHFVHLVGLFIFGCVLSIDFLCTYLSCLFKCFIYNILYLYLCIMCIFSIWPPKMIGTRKNVCVHWQMVLNRASQLHYMILTLVKTVEMFLLLLLTHSLVIFLYFFPSCLPHQTTWVMNWMSNMRCCCTKRIYLARKKIRRKLILYIYIICFERISKTIKQKFE